MGFRTIVILIATASFAVSAGDKRTDVTLAADFASGVSKIDTTDQTSHTLIRRIDDVAALLKSDSLLRVESLQLRGFASPEGSKEVNDRLAGERMQSLERLVRSRIAVSDEAVDRGVARIPWDRLIQRIEKSQMKDKAALQEVLSGDSTITDYGNNQTVDSRVGKLKSLGNATWNNLMNTQFTSIRRAEATITLVRRMPTMEMVAARADTLPTHFDMSKVDITPEQPAIERRVETEGDEWTRHLYLKSNAIGWAMFISNIAIEVDLSERWSLSIPVYYSALNYMRRTRKFRTLACQPEIRYWITDRWYAGAHFGVASYNFAVSSGEWRYQDHNAHTPALGGGISFGWHKPLTANGCWLIELTAGLGAYRLHYDRFHNEANGRLASTDKRAFFGLDNAAVSIVYRFNLKTQKK